MFEVYSVGDLYYYDIPDYGALSGIPAVLVSCNHIVDTIVDEFRRQFTDSKRKLLVVIGASAKESNIKYLLDTVPFSTISCLALDQVHAKSLLGKEIPCIGYYEYLYVVLSSGLWNAEEVRHVLEQRLVHDVGNHTEVTIRAHGEGERVFSDLCKLAAIDELFHETHFCPVYHVDLSGVHSDRRDGIIEKWLAHNPTMDVRFHTGWG